jgi:hypothetical protein
MRVIITAVSTRSQIPRLRDSVSVMLRHLLAQHEVSIIYLLTEHSYIKEFAWAIENGDSRLKIFPILIGSSTWRCYLWHYRELPWIAAQLRADLVHFTYPVPIRRGAFFPPTAFSLDKLQTKNSYANSGILNSLLAPWVRRNYIRVMDETAQLSEPLCQQLGLERIQLTGTSLRKRSSVGQPGSTAVTTTG